MKYCPIRESAKKYPNNVAIYSDNGSITYDVLNHLVDNALDETEIFFADFTIDSIIRFFSLIRQGKTPLPISKREPFLPNINLKELDPKVDTLLCTSGSMGTPKIVMHSLDQHVYSATHQSDRLKLVESDSYHLSLPMNHVGGIAILFRSFCAGASVILGEIHKRFATHISFVPTQLKRFLLSGDRLYYQRLKAILLGGSPIPKKICDWALDRKLPLYLTYGMSETTSQFATALYDKNKGVHYGPPLEGREIRIDKQSEIWVRGKTLFLGYFNQETDFRDGWFRTGDLGKIGRSGLEILGRRDRMIISGGENIYLDEIESSFLEIPQVINAIISERNCEEFGKRPVAHLHTSSPIEISNLVSKLEELIPRYKIPDIKDIHFV